MRAFMMWLAGDTGQKVCVVVGLLSLVLYCCCIVFENKWGD